MKKIFLIIFCVLICFFACGPPKKSKEVNYGLGNTFSQKIKTPVAIFIRERAGAPQIMVSAFIIDKQKGLFASAKHFVGTHADGDCKMFFNGRVYNGTLVNVPAISDIAIIKIVNEFDSSQFPEPYFLGKTHKKGDRVFIRGIHIHRQEYQKNKLVIPILLEYYGLVNYAMKWDGSELVFSPDQDFVYDDLPTIIKNLDRQIKNKDIGIQGKNTTFSEDSIAEISNTYIETETEQDHMFSFGGLSGGPTVDEQGYLVGINSNEFRPLNILDLKHRKIIIMPYNHLNLVPASELEKIMPYLANLK